MFDFSVLFPQYFGSSVKDARAFFHRGKVIPLLKKSFVSFDDLYRIWANVELTPQPDRLDLDSYPFWKWLYRYFYNELEVCHKRSCSSLPFTPWLSLLSAVIQQEF